MDIGAKHIEHPMLDFFAVALVIVLLAGAGFWYRSYSVAQSARLEQERQKALNRQRSDTFNKLMDERAAFIAINSQIDGIMNQVKQKIDGDAAARKQWDEDWAAKKAAYDGDVAAVKAHNEAEDAKFKADPRYQTRDYWTYPAYPPPPPPLTIDFSTEIAALTAQQTSLKDYVTQIKKESSLYGDEVILPVYNDLETSAEEALDALSRDIEILGEIVTNAEQGMVVNEAKADLLKYNAADSGIRALNKKANGLIDELGLDPEDYDLPS